LLAAGKNLLIHNTHSERSLMVVSRDSRGLTQIEHSDGRSWAADKTAAAVTPSQSLTWRVACNCQPVPPLREHF
jgi:hypothetical protein